MNSERITKFYNAVDELEAATADLWKIAAVCRDSVTEEQRERVRLARIELKKLFHARTPLTKQDLNSGMVFTHKVYGWTRKIVGNNGWQLTYQETIAGETFGLAFVNTDSFWKWVKKNSKEFGTGI